MQCSVGIRCSYIVCKNITIYPLATLGKNTYWWHKRYSNPRTVTHASTNQAHCRATILIKTNMLSLMSNCHQQTESRYVHILTRRLLFLSTFPIAKHGNDQTNCNDRDSANDPDDYPQWSARHTRQRYRCATAVPWSQHACNTIWFTAVILHQLVVVTDF